MEAVIIKFNRFFIFFLSLILILNIIPFSYNVDAALISVDLGWDLIASGLRNGNSGLIDFDNYTGDTGNAFHTSSAWSNTSPNSFRIRTNDGLGYWNFTTEFNYISEIKFHGMVDYGSGDADLDMKFYDGEDCVIFLEWDNGIHLEYTGITQGHTNIHNDLQDLPSDEYVIKMTHLYNNKFNFSLYNVTYDLIDWVDEMETMVSDVWTTFDRIEFSDGGGGVQENSIYFDDFDINRAEGPGGSEETIYIYFLDRTTGDYFNTFNMGFWPGPGYFSLTGDLSSDLNNNYTYLVAETGNDFPLEIDCNFDNGDYHYITLSSITSYGSAGGNMAYYDFSTYIQMYDGQTYVFGLTPVGYSDPFYNTQCKWRTDWWIFEGWEACISTDKEYYTSGETVDFYYKMPTVATLVDAGYDSTNWRVGVWNYQNVTDIGGLIFAYEDALEFTSSALTYSDQWETDGNFDPPTPTSGTDIYIAAIYKPGGVFGNVDFIFWDLYIKFYIVEGSFTPSGNITAISPTEPKIGQNVNISFEANNNGKLTYKNLLDEGENDITIFTKFAGIEYANRRFYEYGVYELNLYVSDGAFMQLVDTDYFYINESNATGPGEYLTVRPYYAIAGFDTIFITYKTEVDDTLIDIVDALGQTTAYGTTVDTGGGTYTFDLPPGAAIGTWYVTMYGNDTHTANFTVIADENNYFRFSKNQYYNDEHFAILLNHDKRIAITFYKDGVAQGSDLIFAANQQAQGLYIVPFDIVTPSVGDWYAEMYEINNNIHIRLLAADNCTVINKPTPDVVESYDNILGMLAMAGDVFGGGALGLMVMSIFMLLVIIVILAKFKMDNSVILLITIIAALALSVIGWLPWWITVLAIVLTGLLFGEAFSKKLNLGGK